MHARQLVFTKHPFFRRKVYDLSEESVSEAAKDGRALLFYDNDVLQEARKYWEAGDWQSLANFKQDAFKEHPQRAAISALIAASHFQLGNIQTGREFFFKAISWGYSKALIQRILISGVHQSLGQANAIAGLADKAADHFKRSTVTRDFLVNSKENIRNSYHSQAKLSLTTTQQTFLHSQDSTRKGPAFNQSTIDGRLIESPTSPARETLNPSDAIHLRDMLEPTRAIEVVDIGANPIDGEPPYSLLLQNSLCNVTGFEPQLDALENLLKKKTKNERYLPYVIGSGEAQSFNICYASGMTSLLKARKETIDIFPFFRGLSKIKNNETVETKKLDDIKEIEYVDFLKIDIQGGELVAFQNGRQKLAETVAIQTEISFIPLYENQPTFGEIDIELRQQGFIPHCFPAIKKWPIAPYCKNNDPRAAENQLLEADIVYIRDITQPDLITDEQYKKLALISHYCYCSFDLTLHCISELAKRNSRYLKLKNYYLTFLNKR